MSINKQLKTIRENLKLDKAYVQKLFQIDMELIEDSDVPINLDDLFRLCWLYKINIKDFVKS